MTIGIVGLPNVGKSTLFKILTKKEVAIAAYPFTTINPNVGVVAVPDERLQKLQRIFPTSKIIPTTIEFIDIAGLVKNAHQGAGLGNQFLAHIRETDALVQVVRAFQDPLVPAGETVTSFEEEIELIRLELELADIRKPMIYLINIDNNPPSSLNAFLERHHAKCIVANLSKEMSRPDNIFGLIKKAYGLLELISFFSVKSGEVRAWSVKRGTKAPQAGGKIHSDFEQKFIRAEVINWQKLIEADSWQNAKAKGLIAVKGKDYPIQDGDVIEFKI